MKRTAVILGIAIAGLVAPGTASATGVIQTGISTSPGSADPLTGVIVSGVATSPGSVHPRSGIVQNGFGTSPRSGVIAQRLGPYTGIIVQRLRLLAQSGVLQQ